MGTHRNSSFQFKALSGIMKNDNVSFNDFDNFYCFTCIYLARVLSLFLAERGGITN